MNETAARPATGKTLQLGEAFVGKLREVDPANDPRLARWGYNPGQRNIWIPGREVGGRDRFVPLGEFFVMTSFKTPRENCTLDEYKEKEFNVEVMAQDVENRYKRSLGLDPIEGTDWGFQSFFYGELDVIKVMALNDVLLPTLQEIRVLAEVSPIPQKCPSEDEFDLATPRAFCARCHLQWIESITCDAVVDDALKFGRVKPYVDIDGELKERLVKFSKSEIATARAVIKKGLETYITQASREWQRTVSELEAGTRLQVQDAEHYLRKDLHQPKPQNREVEMIKQMADATKVDNSDVIKTLAEGQSAMQSFMVQMAQQNQVIFAHLGIGAPGPAEKTSGQSKAKTPAKAVETIEQET